MIDQSLNKHTVSQLRVLSEISTLSKVIGFEYWLRGGWAIDFLLGKITRFHDDMPPVILGILLLQK
ncbi:hypothetical protein JYK21_01555 [Ralstonia pickettii]|nr:hypothetical protein [Ralstonia pickettii]